MSKLKKDTRKPVQVSKSTHAVLLAVKEISRQPVGAIIDLLVQEKYPNLYKEQK